MATQKPEAIKSIDGLLNIPNIQITPKVLSELAENLRLKYGVDINGNIFNITREELDGLKSDMEKTKDPAYTLEKFLYEESVETKLENEGLKAVSLDIVTSGIESSRIDDAKKKFELIISNVLDKYDFLDDNTKNLLKLSIANRLLTNPMASEIQNTLSDAGIFIKDFEIKKVGEVSKKVKEISKKSEKYEDAFAPILEEYDEIFKKVGERFSSLGPNLSKEQKQAVISNVEWFKDPNLIEAGVSKFDLTKVDISKTTKDTNIDIENVKKYLLNSRDKIQGLASQLESGDKVADTIYGFLDGDNFISKGVKSFVEMLLEIPFLGKIIAMFLGLDPDNAIAELNENATNFKMFKVLKGLGATKDEKGKKVEGKGIFKNIDLGTLSFNNLKGEIKEIKKSFPNLKEEEYENFFIKAFSEEGFDVNGYKFKFELSQEQRSKSKLETKDIKSSIKDGLEKLSKHRNEQKEIEQARQISEKQAEIGRQATSTHTALETLRMRVGTIEKITTKGYENISDWDSILNVGDIVDISLESIIKNEGDDFSGIIKTEIGEGDYNKLTDDDKIFLNEFFLYIKEYIKGKKDFKVEGSFKKFLEQEAEFKSFKEFIDGKKQSLQQELAKKEADSKALSGQSESLKLQGKIKETLEKINTETKLTQGIDLGNEEAVKFDKDKQELLIGKDRYKVNLSSDGTDYKLSEIIVGEKNIQFDPDIDESKLKLARFLDKDLGIVSKLKVINGIGNLLLSGKYEYVKDKTTLKIEKVS